MRLIPLAVRRLLAVFCCAVVSIGAIPTATASVVNFVFAEDGDLHAIEPMLLRPDIAGVQVVYSWKALEPERDRYDFSVIERDLAAVTKLHKALFIQLQDRFFTPSARNVPAYLLEQARYGGGLVAQTDKPGEGAADVQGWVAPQWNRPLRERYQRLLRTLASQFDGRIAGINLPETAIDIDQESDRSGFSCDAYFRATLDNLHMARLAFRHSVVVQYVNFWPCEWDNDHRYMARVFAMAEREGIGLGGPDVIPWNRAQMHNAYPWFRRFRGRVKPVAMAVQSPTLRYRDPSTGLPFTAAAIARFARDELGADIVFWSSHVPWLAAGDPAPDRR